MTPYLHLIGGDDEIKKYLQAGDIYICKCFKDEFRILISQWKSSDSVENTKSGNPKPPKSDGFMNGFGQLGKRSKLIRSRALLALLILLSTTKTGTS